MRKRIYNWLTAFDDNEGNYRLTENIDVAGFQDRQAAARVFAWSTSASSKKFKGKIEGDGHSIRSIDLTTDSQCAFIPYVENAQIRNLTFENVILGKTDANNTNYMGIFGEPLYIHITSVYNQDNPDDLTSWYGAMKAEGRNYQNFLIMNDLDFSTLSDSVKKDSDLMNLNINRMSGADYTEPTFKNEQESKDYLLFGKRPDQEEGKQEAPKDSYPAGPTITLKNLNMTGESGASWIRALQGTLEGLRFENITWNNSGGGSYIGLIGRSTGTVNYVDFDRITSMPIRQVIMWAVSPIIRAKWNMSV